MDAIISSRQKAQRFFLLALPALVAIWGLNARAANPILNAEAHWPQWRGPLANGVAPNANPPVTWSEESNVKWKIKIPGNGAGTPIIWGNQIFIETALAPAKKTNGTAANTPLRPPANFAGLLQAPPASPPDNQPRRRPPGGGGGGGMRSEKPTEVQQFVLLALDRQTGKTQWQKVVREEIPHEGHHRDHGFASHSPLTDGRLVFAWFGSRGLHCFDLKGEPKWQKDFGRMQTKNAFGEGSSPALFGDTLVVNWDHEGDDFVCALDKETGKERWRQKRNEDTTWSTPLVVTHGGKPQVVVCASERIRSYDLATGTQLWECAGLTANVIPTPVADSERVYAISGFRGNALLAIKLGKTGVLTDTDAIAWRHGKSTPYVPSPLLYDNRLFFYSGNNAIVSCFEASSGRPLIDAERLEGPQGIYASPVGASGRIYLPGRNGVTTVIKNADKLEVLATNRLAEKFDASPAIAGKELYLRGHEYLYCIAEP